MENQPCVYILRCCDGTLYTGWTNQIRQRLAAHNSGSGAKYTRSRRPVTLVYLEFLSDKSAALKREAAIKKMKRAQKEDLIRTYQPKDSSLTIHHLP
ncbi:MAG: GIY-YIG nuclease family protein [Firmicutes bacterium]|nr:GIY-YIG nuclease family protein [Bacillota bacterium]